MVSMACQVANADSGHGMQVCRISGRHSDGHLREGPPCQAMPHVRNHSIKGVNPLRQQRLTATHMPLLPDSVLTMTATGAGSVLPKTPGLTTASAHSPTRGSSLKTPRAHFTRPTACRAGRSCCTVGSNVVK
jgi:hypothetical protein